MKLFARIALASSLILSSHPAWSQQNAVGPIAIKAKGIDTRSLVGVAADIAKVNLIVGDEFLDRRIDIDQADLTPMALIERMAAEQQLAVKRSGDTLLVASPCRLAQAPDIPSLPGDREKVSFNFERVSARTLAGAEGILRDEWRVTIDSAGVDGMAGLSIKYWDGAIRDELSAIAIVEGWDVKADGTGGIRILPNKAVEQCRAEAGNHESKTVKYADPVEPPPCPGTSSSIHCEPAETYELSEIVTRGWIKFGKGPVQRAILEMPGSHVYLLRVGDYMGKNDGKIVDISDKGIKLVEMRQDANGLWKKWPLVLPYR